MPLSNGYGVVIGNLVNHYIDPPNNIGQWPHYHLVVSTPAGNYECVINLKSISSIKIEYRDFRNANTTYFANILSRPNGFHPLTQDANSGALDFIRHPGLKNPICPSQRWPWLIRKKPRQILCTSWWLENGTDVIELMQYYLLNVNRVFVFGEPYNTGLGVHNVHMNQGDPVGSQFAAENGIWQDGGMMLEYNLPQPRLSVFNTKFQTQSMRTDAQGRPV